MVGKAFRTGLVYLAAAAALLGQSFSSVGGTVRDPSGAVIPSARIALVNTDTGAERNGVTDAQGRYSFSQVQPGSYKITAQAPGFRKLS